MGPYEPEAMSHSWTYESAEVGAQQRRLAAIAEVGEGHPSLSVVAQMWEAMMGEPMPDVTERPGAHLSESWFCCAEPTQSQRLAVARI
jgi:hypothetical protein